MITGIHWKLYAATFAVICLMVAFGWRTAAGSSGPQAVTTFHNDNLRTGWNSNETVLTPVNVNSTTFGLLYSVPLDDQVDSQPLIVPGVAVTAGLHQGQHDVVYVATENNTIYAIDAESGVVLLQSSQLGTPVNMRTCNNNGPRIGITSTPVIDVASNTIYAIAYSSVNGAPAYTLHALDLGNLQDKGNIPVNAFHAIAGETDVYILNPVVSRQRPALLLANGNIYAGFGSFCDHNNSTTRGWVLGWNAGNLAPLPNNQLTDNQGFASSSYYLSSVWMSGSGLAADATGNIYFVTGNSDPVNNVYDGVTDIQESVVKLPPDLSSVSDIFTPSNEFTLDQKDADFSSGGVLLLPPQPGPIPNLVAAAGKQGNLFLLNQNALGGFNSNNSGVISNASIGPCWCGQSYFNDGVGHIVSSGMHTVNLWTVQTSPTVKLVHTALQNITSGLDPGFFTSVSSSGANNAIIWAVSRPLGVSNTSISLYALNATPSNGALPILYQATAGSWPNLQGNANIVPVVANGYVYVASYKQLAIFGLIGTGGAAHAPPPQPAATYLLSNSQHLVYGKITAVNGSRFTLRRRTGELVHVNAKLAIQSELSIDLFIGRAVSVQGTFDDGVLLATLIQRAKESSATWPPDI